MRKILFTFLFTALSFSLFAQLDGVNLAEGKPVEASSEEGIFVAESAVDGDIGTRWASLAADNEWISIDLGSRYAIDSVVFHWENLVASAAEAEIQGSYDGIYWFNMATFVKDNEEVSDTVVLDDITRYVRMQGVQRTGIYGYSTWEIEVFGYNEITTNMNSLSCTPEQSNLDFGQTLQLNIAATDENGDPVALGANNTWSVDNGGTIDQDGLFLADKIGDFKVTVLSDDLQLGDTALISVTSTDQVPSSIEITPAIDTLTQGETVQLTATVYDQHGVEMAVTVDWSTLFNTVDGTGLFTADYTGKQKVVGSVTYTIAGITGTISDTALIAVYPSSTQNIALLYESVGAASEAQPAADAVDGDLTQRWECVADEPDMSWVVKLDAVYDLGAIAIEWETAGAQSYEIQMSNDSSTWTTIYQVNPDDTTRATPDHSIDSLPVHGSAQYVRFVGLSRSFNNYGPSFWEFRIYPAANSYAGSPVLSTITVTPADASIVEGETQQYTASGFDQYGDPFATTFTWSVSGGGSIDAAGLFTSTTAGTFDVTATSGSVTGTVSVTVTAAPVLTTINVTPDGASIVEGETQQYTASGVDQFGNPFATTFTWSVSGGGTIDASGLFTASAAGTFDVTATSGSVTGTVSVTVTAAPVLTTINVTPDGASIVEGETQQYTASGVDQYGDPFATTFTWSVSGGGSINATGLFTSTTAGTYDVTATSGSVTGTVQVTVTDQPPVLTTITVTPADASIVEGETQQYTASGLDQFGNPFATTFTWSVSGGGSINATGLFTSTTAGTYDVTATSGSITGSVSVTVTEPTPVLSTITVTPADASIVEGETQQYTASGLDQFGNPFATTFTWSVSGGGSINATGLFTSTTAGTYDVTATSGSVTGTVQVTVTQPSPVLTTITVTPAGASIVEGETQQYTASGLDQYGDPIATTFTWSVSGGGTIDASGLFTATTAGTYDVTATSGSVTGTVSVTVTEIPVLATITVTPAGVSILDGETQQYTASGVDQFGNPFTTTFTWSVSGGGTIDASGLFTASAAGTYDVTATSGSVTGTVQLTVTEQPPVLITINVTPADASIVDGETQQYTASGVDQFGNPFATTFTWSVSGGGSIDASGLFTASAAGTYDVTATSGSVTGTVSVTVTESPVLATITVTPAGASIVDGETQQYTASGVDQFGNPFATTFTWSVSGGGSIDASGLFTASAAGTYDVTATSGSISESVVVTVTEQPPVLTTLTITPADASIVEGETQQYSVAGADQFGNLIGLTPTWSVSGGGTIAPTGLFTASAAGTFYVIVTSGSVADSVAVTITEAPALAALEITPATATIGVGESQQFSATGTDQFGNDIDVSVTWSATGGTINATGLFTSDADGVFTVSAEQDGVSATAEITVDIIESINVSETIDFKVFPVPAADNITIEFGETSYQQIEVVSFTGAVIINQSIEQYLQTAEISLDNLDSGVYYIVLTNDNSKVSYKIIKQ